MKQVTCNNYVEGKVIIETGAAGGFGLATVEKLCGMGAKVVMADYDAEALEREAARLKGLGYDVVPVVTDVSKPEQVRNMVKVCLDTYGQVDVLVNNAGIMPNAVVHCINQPMGVSISEITARATNELYSL